MSEREDNLPPERLMEAVDAIYAAQEEFAQIGGIPGYPADLLGGPSQPDSFVDFTRYEIEEGTAFLTRMGLLRIRPGGSVGGSRSG